jgi:hypothetical protein
VARREGRSFCQRMGENDTMKLPNVDKKLREARFFLGKMGDQERLAFGDKEPFDFFLSAFLSAARSVDYRLRHEQKALYPSWRASWNAALPPHQDLLIKFLVDDRALEVHESGSGRSVQREGIPVGDVYHDGSGTVHISAPPGTPPAIIHKPSYQFTIGGNSRRVVDACAEYLGLLEGMVAKFQADNP